MKQFIIIAALVVSTVATASDFKHLFGLSYNGSATASFEDGYFNDGSTSYSYEAELEYDEAFGLIYEARSVEKNSWGFAVGGEYIGKREFDRAEITVNGTTTSLNGSGDVDSFTTLRVYLNAIYQWDIFYIPFGINMTGINYKGEGDSDMTGGFGANFGLGWQLGERAFLELMGKANKVEISGVENADYGDGVLSTGSIQFLYNFF